MNLPKLKENKLLKFIGSIRMALILFLVIILVSFVGALVPTEFQANIYYSWWFFLLLILFALNLFACSLERLLFSRKKWSSTITHLSVLVILLGSLISFLFSSRGTVEFVEGQTKDSFISEKGLKPLNFKVILQDFNLEWYTPDNFKVRVYVKAKGVKRKYQAILGEEYKIKDTDYAFSVLRYLPDFKIDEERKVSNNSAQPNNPAILINIKSPFRSEERWLFTKHPMVAPEADENIKFIFDGEPMIKEFTSTVKFIDGEKQEIKTIKVNSPVQFKGYTFYQTGYDPKRLDWTALEVVRDPGVSIVFAGFILLNAGIILVYLQKVKRDRQKEQVAICK
jgi:hypothetical protein